MHAKIFICLIPELIILAILAFSPSLAISLSLIFVLGILIIGQSFYIYKLFSPIKTLLASFKTADLKQLNSQCLAATQQLSDCQAKLKKSEEQNSHLKISQSELENELSAQQTKYNKFLEATNTMAKKATTMSGEIHSAMLELMERISQIDQGMRHQQIEVGETSTTIENILDSVNDVATRAKHTSQKSHQGRQKAGQGISRVENTVETINQIKTKTLALNDSMQQLGAVADNIGSVMNVIREVADQTNLLALNAAIEAARAGDAGRGFAVVADEVRKLAERTMTATTEVNQAIQNIQTQTRSNMEAVDSTAASAIEGANQVNQLGDFMTSIIDDMQATSKDMDEVANQTEVQSNSSINAKHAVHNINTIVKSTADQLTEVTSALVQISSHISGLDLLIHNLASNNISNKNSSKLIEWTPKLATKITSIDDQHKVLCNMINDLYAAMVNREADNIIQDIISGLEQYTKTHFSHEEKLFSATKYPLTNEHKKVHRKFEAKIAETKNDIIQNQAAVSMDLLNFLKDWLITHIEGTDFGYAKYVRK